MVNCCCSDARRRPRVCRPVPAFSVQSRQCNTCVVPPPRRPLRPCKCVSAFRMFYQRRDLPISFHFDRFGMKLAWKVELEKLDYHRFLPLFFEGLCENDYPYKIQARQGVKEMLEHGGARVLPVIPQLIFPIKKAMNTRVPEVLTATMCAIIQLVTTTPCAGLALVPYFRQILPVFNEFIGKNVNIGDDIDTSTARGENAGDLVMETLQTLERFGGEDAYINIKYMIPTYESCVLN